MKVRITDLLDQYEDHTVVLDPFSGRQGDSAAKETIPLKESKHSFGWRQGLSIAAVLALLIVGGFGMRKLLQGRKAPAVPANTVPAASQTDPSTDPHQEDVTLSDEEQTALNRFLTCLSQQGITEFDGTGTSEYDLASFAHLYCKFNDWSSITYRTRDEMSYETLTLEQVNEVLNKFFNLAIHPEASVDYNEGRDLKNASPALFVDNTFYFPAADGDMHTQFTVCDTAKRNPDGSLTVTYIVYDVKDLDDYVENGNGKYASLRIADAEALVGQGVLYKTMNGTATLLAGEGDEWTLLSYYAEFIEVEPGHREDDEEFPQEYPVENYKLSGGVFAQSGMLNAYRYESLPIDEGFWIVLHRYSESVLGCEGQLSLEQDSYHDGYANWFMRGPGCGASVSGSDITGRFTFNLQTGFDRILDMTEAKIEDRDMMEQKARAFVSMFAEITGDLVLDHQVEDTCYYHDERSDELKDVTVPCVTFYFRNQNAGLPMLRVQDGRDIPVPCGDSNVMDLNYHCFAVTVWPDGTVVSANNYVSRAEIVPNGTIRMLDEGDLPTLLEFFTSTAEHDTVVIESISADQYSVYFGSANIEPTVTVTYYYESDPENKQSTIFVLPGLFD